MFQSFFESVKYVGHLVPLAFLRVFMGYYYLQQALLKYRGDFLQRPHIAESLSEWVPSSHAPLWYKLLVNNYFVPHWQTVAFILTGLELAIAISYILGYVVRPVALLAIMLCVFMLFSGGPSSEDLYKTFLAIHLSFAWVGAGRCLGFDYYFYKRQRGVWW